MKPLRFSSRAPAVSHILPPPRPPFLPQPKVPLRVPEMTQDCRGEVLTRWVAEVP